MHFTISGTYLVPESILVKLATILVNHIIYSMHTVGGPAKAEKILIL
jgi:hypothetical protein